MNVLPGLSLFPLVFICIFAVWLPEVVIFVSLVKILWETSFFSLSLMLFGGRIDDFCNGCFDEDLALLGVIDPTCFCLDYNIGSLPIPNMLLSWY